MGRRVADIVPINKSKITAVVLAGGRARRLKGQDKGLMLLNGQPLIQKAVETLKQEVKTVFISANRNHEAYTQYAPVLSDNLPDYQGPLAGIAKAMYKADTPYLFVMPCDAPFIDKHLIETLENTLQTTQADISVAFDGKRLFPVISLIKISLLKNLQTFLDQGDRKASLWFQQNKMAKVDLPQHPEYFYNLNTPTDFAALMTNKGDTRVLGFSAFSGVGKTHLMTQVIGKLRKTGLRIGVIKHAHHNVDIDQKGKDSYRHRKAGAQQVLLASDKRSALMTEYTADPPNFKDLLAVLDTRELDLILVEGFKHEKINKIELQRTELGHPVLYLNDKNVIALASDDTKQTIIGPILLDLNNVEEIVKFILAYAKHP